MKELIFLQMFFNSGVQVEVFQILLQDYQIKLFIQHIIFTTWIVVLVIFGVEVLGVEVIQLGNQSTDLMFNNIINLVKKGKLLVESFVHGEN